ncbi:DUF6438 domain-containing protein [Hymenobacter psychrophilus]|uniref:DUF6438 domain-containing protein n=1 Tax=Hymenobacter psychrophilus TaxID=651662 RepID=A0A1H3ASR9_9BACT|nr:DUF6438 domain-containing protein [Hymenobacter psychrophilus]SDX32448.1 hypothetical protein SAMN04488069_10121 [Hymenobacter psychrophilus]
MRTPLLLPLLTLVLSLPSLPACKASRPATAAQPPATTTTVAAPLPKQQEPVLAFGRTSCFGTCPDYTARFFADGRVEYEGRKHAPVEGNRTVKIDPAVVQQLLREADQIGFSQLRDVYSKGAVDLPSTILSITTAKGTKSVRVDEGGPEGLQKLFVRLDLEVNKALGVVADK